MTYQLHHKKKHGLGAWQIAKFPCVLRRAIASKAIEKNLKVTVLATEAIGLFLERHKHDAEKPGHFIGKERRAWQLLRFPHNLRSRVTDYAITHGCKVSQVVAWAVYEYIQREEEYAQDNRLAKIANSKPNHPGSD
jgi:hypothetical protein